MRRMGMVCAAMALLSGLGCQDGGRSGEPDPDPVIGDFAVRVIGSASLLEAGQSATYSLEVGPGAESPLEVDWQLEAGSVVDDSDPLLREVLYETEGIHRIAVRVTDAGGRFRQTGALARVLPAGRQHRVGDVDDSGTVDAADVAAAAGHIDSTARLAGAAFDRADVMVDDRVDGEDLALIRDAADNGLAPVYLSAEQGSPSLKLSIIHPALLDPAVPAELHFGQRTVVPFRGAPGYATTRVPLDMPPGPVDLRLVVGGEPAESWAFEVLALPEPASPPGAQLTATLEKLGTALDGLDAALQPYADRLDAGASGQLVLVQFPAALAQMYAEQLDELLAALESLDPEALALVEQVARANGLDAVEQGLDALIEDLQRLRIQTRAPADDTQLLIEVICTAEAAVEFSEGVAEITDSIDAVVGTIGPALQWFPVVGQVIKAIQQTTMIITVITDCIDLVAQFIPSFSEDMVLSLDAAQIAAGQQASVEAELQLNLYSDLCKGGAEMVIDTLLDKLTEKVIKGLAQQIPGMDEAFRRYHYAREDMNFVTGGIYDLLSEMIGAIVDAVHLRDAMIDLAESLCDQLDDPLLPIEPESIHAHCGFYTGGAWRCNDECIGTVTLEATHPLCLGSNASGTIDIECLPCDADTCPDGCCTPEEICVTLDEQTDDRCGRDAAACEACAAPYDTCDAGDCICVSNCDPAQRSGRCASQTHVEICTEIATDCWQWVDQGPCAHGGVCQTDGSGATCQGGCDPAACQAGCCDRTSLPHTCTPYASQERTLCGDGGADCAPCPDSDHGCFDGQCDCRDECEQGQSQCHQGVAMRCTGLSENGCTRWEAEDCGMGCADGECIPCDAESCPDGCCRTDLCYGYDEQSTDRCGTGGAACTVCPNADQLCLAGACQCEDECELGLGECLDADTEMTCTGVSPSGCTRWQTQPCPQDQSCDGGSCSCLHECEENGSECQADGGVVADCTGRTDPSGCRFWEHTACSGGDRCFVDDGVANCRQPTPMSLGVVIVGSGGVAGEPGGIHCPGSCQTTQDENTLVELVAYPAEGWAFEAWGDCDHPIGNLCLQTLDAGIEQVTAQFVPSNSIPPEQRLGCPFNDDGLVNLGEMRWEDAGAPPLYWDPAGSTSGGYPDQPDPTVVSQVNVFPALDFAVTHVCIFVNYDMGETPMEVFIGEDLETGIDGGPVQVHHSQAATSSGNGWQLIALDSPQNLGADENLVGVTFLEAERQNGNIGSDPARAPGTPGQAAIGLAVGSVDPQRPEIWYDYEADEVSSGPYFNGHRPVIRALRMASADGFSDIGVGIEGPGEVVGGPGGIQCGGAVDRCSLPHEQGLSVTLLALPDAGHAFGGWSGCDAASGPICHVTPNDSPVQVQAQFQ